MSSEETEVKPGVSQLINIFTSGALLRAHFPQGHIPWFCSYLYMNSNSLVHMGQKSREYFWCKLLEVGVFQGICPFYLSCLWA